MRLLLSVCCLLSAVGWLSAQDTDKPLPALQAAAQAVVPAGFAVSLFAGEPDVMQPIGFCIDDRGRLWVAEAYNYPNRGQDAGDRIIILEDSDGDGTHDKRTIFYEGLNYVTGIEKGFGGVWVMSPPSLVFIPDRDDNDRPDGPPEILLDGFGNFDNAHNLANGFAWGPDGWLYGTHGRTNWSMIGKPGTPAVDRVRFDGGVYRYHPVRHVWESYADGTTNPWGIDWNDYGHAFICNCVNPHLFQVIQGAHYEPWRGRASSRYAYQRIDTIADHLHFTGLSHVRNGLGTAAEDAAGGGHAHCGTMIYLGDSFPDHYRNSLFTNNIHGRRINNDLLKPLGSGYTASHGADLLRSADPWFMGVTLTYGPAGEVYVSDWSDTGECHSTKNTRRHTGRIFRITYGESHLPGSDLPQLSNAELVELQLHKNDWQVRHARRLLYERATAGMDMSAVHDRLLEIFSTEPTVPRRLRGLWALKVTGGLNERLLVQSLDDASEDVRAWAITLLCEAGAPPPTTLSRLVELASSDPSPRVRLSLASALQRFALSERWHLAIALASRGEDQTDANLPLMIWYGCEPLVHEDLQRFARLAASAEISRVRINAARRIAESNRAAEGLELLVQQLNSNLPDYVAVDLLNGMLEGMEGNRKLLMPDSWRAAFARLSQSENSQLKDLIVRMAVVFHDQEALHVLRGIAADPKRAVDDRKRAIDTLVAQRVAGFDNGLVKLLSDQAVRSSVLRGLAAYNHPATPAAILGIYPMLHADEQQDAQLTLASRASWAKELLDAVAAGKIRASELTAYTARQIRALGSQPLNTQLTQVWGEVRESPRDRAKEIESIKKWLNADALANADLIRGKQLFAKQCAACHTLFGEGGKIGPDITGAQRTNLDAMLENVIDPNAAVAKDYQMEILQTEDGRVVTGLIETENSETITVQTLNERLVFPVEEVLDRKRSQNSIMPQGLLEALSEDEIRDLFGYLQRRQ